ncbi:hypothetical protein JHJ32_21100 [Parapedobacter sp. ISTM3]|uniref:hypothetical protein n=1 Tax=Parapedobacter sp. ISTM3 TaxID=2800130 RepID=UPI001905A535|nr:hypothetical protein [Parapedobacter sp. ISTM3]MBK1442510.1 hypothetical protein [Parapedobacter sp. ISTM3]
MTEFERHIEFYKLYWHQHFSKVVPEDKWGDKKLAEEYLKKYWLPEQEYLSVWKPIQDKIFVQGKSLPNLIYHSEFEMIVANGGCLFLEEDFKQLQKAILSIGEMYFVVVQNIQEYTNGEPMFRMKFPVNITWEELISGNYISAVLLEMSLNEYFVFGENGNWGKYSANDYEHPLDIIGFKSELAPIFQEHFKQPKEEQQEIREWLPQEYKKLIK